MLVSIGLSSSWQGIAYAMLRVCDGCDGCEDVLGTDQDGAPGPLT